MNMNYKTILAGAAVAVGLYWLAKREAGAALAKVGEAVNPTSDKNLAYTGVNAVGAAVSGDKDWTLGGAIYDIFHASFDPNAPMRTNILDAKSDADGKPSILR